MSLKHLFSSCLGFLVGIAFVGNVFADVEVSTQNLTKDYSLVFVPYKLESYPAANCAEWSQKPSGNPIGYGQYETWIVEHSGIWCGLNDVGSIVEMSVLTSDGSILGTCEIEVVSSGGGTGPTFYTKCDTSTVNIEDEDYSNGAINPHYKVVITE